MMSLLTGPEQCHSTSAPGQVVQQRGKVPESLIGGRIGNIINLSLNDK